MGPLQPGLPVTAAEGVVRAGVRLLRTSLRSGPNHFPHRLLRLRGGQEVLGPVHELTFHRQTGPKVGHIRPWKGHFSSTPEACGDAIRQSFHSSGLQTSLNQSTQQVINLPCLKSRTR